MRRTKMQTDVRERAAAARYSAEDADLALRLWKRLKARLGEMLLERELLEAKVAALEGGRPLVRRRSRP